MNIENLGDNMVKMSNELSLWQLWQENEAMEVEEELVVLEEPIYLPKLERNCQKPLTYCPPV